MANENKAPRITKSQRFEDIIAMLNGGDVKYGTTAEIATEVIEHEMELLAKKNSGESKKQTAAQLENEGYKELICEFLAGAEGGVTCTTIQKSVPAFADFNNQKISALVRQLVAAGRVKKDEVKGKAMFSLA